MIGGDTTSITMSLTMDKSKPQLSYLVHRGYQIHYCDVTRFRVTSAQQTSVSRWGRRSHQHMLRTTLHANYCHLPADENNIISLNLILGSMRVSGPYQTTCRIHLLQQRMPSKNPHPLTQYNTLPLHTQQLCHALFLRIIEPA